MRFFIKQLALLTLTALVLSGCFINGMVRESDDEADYRKCLLEHTTQPALCDQLKQLYEADKGN
jgi:hypothetical protein